MYNFATNKYTKIMQKTIVYGIEWHKILDSTSAEIHRRHGDMQSGTVVAAALQTCGRGQGDHKWHSEEGQNLTFSVYCNYSGRPVFKAVSQQLLTMASSLAVCDFLADYGVKAGIKKPNDIYVDGMKICGMLIENSLSGPDMSWSIIGIGININQTVFPSDLPNPVSLSNITGGQYDIKKCLREFLRHFSFRFDAIWTEPEALNKEYLNKLISI